VPRAAALFAVLSLAAATLGSPAARAVGPSDFSGARALGMGVSRATAVSNDAIFLNPAGLGAAPRYVLEFDYNHDTSTKDAATGGDGIALSIADSVSNPKYPTGIAYRYMATGSGAQEFKGHVTDLAMAFPMAEKMLLGARLTYLAYNYGGTDLMRVTGDLGWLLAAGNFAVGLVGFNLVDVDQFPGADRGLGAGVSYGDPKVWRVGADYRLDYPGQAKHSFALGGEFLLAEAFPMRAGWIWDGLRNTQYWSAGTGIVTKEFGFDVSYRRDTSSGENLLGIALKIFVN
jgi:hypothetical protein